MIASVVVGAFGPRSDSLVDLVTHPLWVSSRLVLLVGVLLIGLGLGYVFRTLAARKRVLADTGLAALVVGIVMLVVEFAIAGMAAPGLVAVTDLTPQQLSLVLEAYRALGSALGFLGIAFIGTSVLLLAVTLYRADVYHPAVAGLGTLTGVVVLAAFAIEVFPGVASGVPAGPVAIFLLLVWLLVLAVSAFRANVPTVSSDEPDTQ